MDSTSSPQTASDGLYFLAIMLKYKFFIIIITVLSAIASVIIALSLPVWYASTVNFVPPQESATNASSGAGLGAVMRNFGLAKLSGSSSSEFTPLVFLESRSVLDSIITKHDLASAYGMQGGKISAIRTAFRSNLLIEYLEEGNYSVTVWDQNNEKAAAIANDYVQITNHFIRQNHKNELVSNIEYLTNRVQSIDSSIDALSAELNKISHTKNVYSPEEQARAAATAIGTLKETEIQQEILYDQLNNLYGEDDPRTINAKELYLTVKSKVADAFAKPGFIGNFALRDVTPVAVEYAKKYIDIEAFTQMKALLMTSLEKSKLDNHTSTPNFFIIDEAVPADTKDKPRRSFIVAGGTFGGFMLSVLLLLIINGFKVALKQSKNLLK